MAEALAGMELTTRNTESNKGAGAHCLVSGLVQGVGFRYAAMTEARRLGLRGWVRNLPDGRVEAEAFGDSAALDSFCDWLQQGPRSARVSLVQVKPAAWQEGPEPFEIR